MLRLVLFAGLLAIAFGDQSANTQQYNEYPYYPVGRQYNVFRDLEGFKNPQEYNHGRNYAPGFPYNNQPEYYRGSFADYQQEYPYSYQQVFGSQAQAYPFYGHQSQRPFGFFFRGGDEVQESVQQRYGFYPVRDSNGQSVGYYTKYPYSSDYEFQAEGVPSELNGYGFQHVADDQGRVSSFVFRNPEYFYSRFGSQYGNQPANFYGSQQSYYPQSYNNFGSDYEYQPSRFYGSQGYNGFQPQFYGQQYAYPNKFSSYNKEYQPQYYGQQYSYPTKFSSYNEGFQPQYNGQQYSDPSQFSSYNKGFQPQYNGQQYAYPNKFSSYNKGFQPQYNGQQYSDPSQFSSYNKESQPQYYYNQPYHYPSQ